MPIGRGWDLRRSSHHGGRSLLTPKTKWEDHMLQRHPARTIHRAMPTARSHKRWAARATLVSAIGVLVFQIIPAQAAQPRVGLGTAAAYGVLAGQGVTNTGPSVINGNVGTSPNGSVTGFPPGLVHGAIHRADAAALQAQSDLTTAYNDAAGRTPVTTIATELGGRRLTPASTTRPQAHSTSRAPLRSMPRVTPTASSSSRRHQRS